MVECHTNLVTPSTLYTEILIEVESLQTPIKFLCKSSIANK